MTLNSELSRILRRIKPERRRPPLTRRPDEALAFAPPERAPPGLLLDATVYIDQLQGRFPATLDGLLRACPLWHSAVALAELSTPLGRLDPAHPGTRSASRQIRATLARVPEHRLLTPDLPVWCEAAIVSGMIARLRREATSQRLLNDALIFFAARRNGSTVLTRNITDFDVLDQLVPDGRVLFYRI